MSKTAKVDISEIYVEAAILHGEASKEGDYRTANKQYRKLTKVYKDLEKDRVFAKSFLRKLFIHANVSVRLWASTHALDLSIDTKTASNVLEEISRNDELDITRLTAETTLKEWKRRLSRVLNQKAKPREKRQ